MIQFTEKGLLPHRLGLDPWSEGLNTVLWKKGIRHDESRERWQKPFSSLRSMSLLGRNRSLFWRWPNTRRTLSKHLPQYSHVSCETVYHKRPIKLDLSVPLVIFLVCVSSTLRLPNSLYRFQCVTWSRSTAKLSLREGREGRDTVTK